VERGGYVVTTKIRPPKKILSFSYVWQVVAQKIIPAEKLSRLDVTSWQDTNFKDFKTPGINGDFGFSSITQVPFEDISVSFSHLVSVWPTE